MDRSGSMGRSAGRTTSMSTVRFSDARGSSAMPHPGASTDQLREMAHSAPDGFRGEPSGRPGGKGMLLPSINKSSQRAQTYDPARKTRKRDSVASRGSVRSMQSMPAGRRGTGSWSAEPRPDWVQRPSDELYDLVKLEDRFRKLHSRESSALEARMQTFSREHRELLVRQTQTTPLVVCVLDRFASGGGLLRTHAGQDVSFAIQVKYSFAGHLGEGGEDLRSWVDTNGGFSCHLSGASQITADVVYQGAGTFVFFYKPMLAGKYLVSVRLGNGDVPGSPFESLVAPGNTNTTACTASGLGLLCAEAGVEAAFSITSRDQFGNQRSSGSDQYDVGLTGPVCFNAKVTDQDDGKYLVRYNTIMCGDYYVSIRRDGEPITGSPFVLSVVAGKTHGPSCTSVGDGLTTAFAGHEAEFVIEARDIISNQRVVGDDPFEVQMDGPATPQISVFDRDDGTYLVTYVVEATGSYTVRISLHGLAISGSPFMPTVMPGRVVAVRCSGMGRGLTRAYAGEDAQFTIESRDINRNKTTSGTKPFLVSIRGIISPQVHCILGDEGEFHYSYRTARAGTYFVGALLDGVDIGGSPFKLTVDPGPTHANGCSASGPGITGGYTGMETSLVIQARDYYGNARTTGGDVFNIDIGGTAAARLRLRDNENGTYTVAYTPEIGGDYYISVKHNGIDIQSSPFTISSDPMPREGYLEMYRSMEPDFGRNLQAQMLGKSDKKEQPKASKRKTKAAGTQWDLRVQLLSGKELQAKDTVAEGTYGTGFTHSSDPYVVFKIGSKTVRSKTVEKNLNPEWNEEMTLPVEDRMMKLLVEVYDEDKDDEDDIMGQASVGMLDLVEGKAKMCTVKLLGQDGSGEGEYGEVSMVLTIAPAKGSNDDKMLR